MAIAKQESELDTINRIVRQIAERFHPKKVILFGSYADGTSHENSDVDLLVLMEAENNPLRTAARISANIDHPIPLDILVMEPHRFDEALQRGAIFVTEVANRGIALYEA
jgi:uncharacterized protein